MAGRAAQAGGLRAAQYVRMSTEHQQYSTHNQSDTIRDYAERRGIEIVRTYADEGKSGLSIGGRTALQRLIADVEGGAADFEVILVYDVSRWGRFQDADESKIAGADPTLAICTGTIKLRFDGATLMADAAGGDPVALSYALTMAEGCMLSFDLFRVFLPKPKDTISGPGGIEASFDWRAAYGDATATMLRARLLNDVASHG
jgi:hypothetical protein